MFAVPIYFNFFLKLLFWLMIFLWFLVVFCFGNAYDFVFVFVAVCFFLLYALVFYVVSFCCMHFVFYVYCRVLPDLLSLMFFH